MSAEAAPQIRLVGGRNASHLDDQEERRRGIEGTVVEGDDGGAPRAKEISYLQREERGTFYRCCSESLL